MWLFSDRLTAEEGCVKVFQSAFVVVDVPVKTTGVTGDKHLCSVAVSGDERRKNVAVLVDGCGFAQRVYNQ
ncbi:hypothetical protein HanRHA438_Chr13g0596201 [Helianthus annuus]|nr:hypothetical protein HanRHA438_Chr13g0596201 [Helianthus annuus]